MVLSLISASAACWGGLAGLGGVAAGLAFERWRRARRPSASDLVDEHRARIRDQRGLQRTLEELLTSVERVAERVERDTDARIARLEELLRRADERLALLGAESYPRRDAREVADTALEGEAAAVEARTTSLLAGAAAPAADSAVLRGGSLRERVAAARARRPALSIVRPAQRDRDKAAASCGERAIACSAAASDLLSAGMAVAVVAERLNAPIGEIELVAALREFGAEFATAETLVRVA